MKINLNIERLVLEGIDLPVSQQGHLRAAVEAELGRLLSTGRVPGGLARGAALPSLRAGDIQLGVRVAPVGLGHQIARTLYGGISK